MAERIGPDFFYDLVTVSSPSITTDGGRVAFVKSVADRETAKTASHVVVADVGTGVLQDFTRVDHDSLPRWSPDNAALAFLRQDGKEKSQIWVMASSMGEAHQITSQPGGVTDLQWSPDGSQLVFVSTVDARDEDPEPAKQPVVVTHLRYKADGHGLRGQGRAHLFVVHVSGGEAKQLTSGDIDHFAPVWSPDGSQIAFVAARDFNREFQSRTEAYTMPAGGGVLKMASGGLYAVGGVAWSPDGSQLAAIGTASVADGGSCSVMCQSWLYLLEGGEAQESISDDGIYPVVDGYYDHAAGELRWTGDGRILFSGAAQGQGYVCVARPGSTEVERLAGGGVQISSWSVTPDGTKAAVVANSPNDYGELVVYDLSDGSSKKLTSYNDEWLASHPQASIEKFTFDRDGVELEARLHFPPDFDESKKYPLLLDVHGGPHSAFFDTFYPLHQAPASAGYVVLAINPRGSSTYGRDFALAAHNDWGGEPYEDLMHGLELVARRPYIDNDRIVMHGSSYGGYMGSWMAGHTDRFKAIAIAAPVTNVVSFYGTSDIGVHFSEIELGGGLEKFAEFVRHSPLFYAGNVTTPVLIMHGENDDRVPIEQGEQYFTALRRLGKEVEFVRLPDTSHGLFRNPNLRMREEYFTRILEWFARYIEVG